MPRRLEDSDSLIQEGKFVLLALYLGDDFSAAILEGLNKIIHPPRIGKFASQLQNGVGAFAT
jgi:hypothetical protein